MEAQSHKSHQKAELNKTFMHKRESISKPILFYPTFDFTKPSRNRLGQVPARNTGGPGPASRYNQSNANVETRWTLPSKNTNSREIRNGARTSPSGRRNNNQKKSGTTHASRTGDVLAAANDSILSSYAQPSRDVQAPS